MHASGAVRSCLRFEGLGVLAVSALVYHQNGHSWPLFALTFLAPDLTMLGYLAGPRVGARLYNLGHSYVGPLLLTAIAILWFRPGFLALALIWGAHIGLDRALGYGLKYPTGFRDTHLGTIGPAATRKSPVPSMSK